MLEVYSNSISYRSKIILNKFLKDLIDMFIDFYNDDKSVGSDLLEEILPRLVYHENKVKFEEALTTLHLYLTDQFTHQLTPFYDQLLYGIINYLDTLNNDKFLHLECSEMNIELYDNGSTCENFKSKKECKECENRIDCSSFTLEDIIDDLGYLYDLLFYNFDFLYFPWYFEEYKEAYYNNKRIIMYVDFDNYVELMPADIRKEWEKIKPRYVMQAKEILEFGPKNMDEFKSYIHEFVQRFRHSIVEKGAYKLLWNDNFTPRKEEIVQILFENLINKDCKLNNIDMSREVQTGRGFVDFKFSNGQKYKMFLEIKLASNSISKLKHGLESQTLQYLVSEQINTAIYLIVIHNEEDYEKANYLLRLANEFNLSKSLDIIVEIIDATRNKKSASKIRI